MDGYSMQRMHLRARIASWSFCLNPPSLYLEYYSMSSFPSLCGHVTLQGLDGLLPDCPKGGVAEVLLVASWVGYCQDPELVRGLGGGGAVFLLPMCWSLHMGWCVWGLWPVGRPWGGPGGLCRPLPCCLAVPGLCRWEFVRLLH